MHISITLASKVETLLGFLIDQGEYERTPGNWVPFTRIRLGAILLIFDVMWYHKKS